MGPFTIAKPSLILEDLDQTIFEEKLFYYIAYVFLVEPGKLN